jgi:hypothetical protein
LGELASAQQRLRSRGRLASRQLDEVANVHPTLGCVTMHVPAEPKCVAKPQAYMGILRLDAPGQCGPEIRVVSRQAVQPDALFWSVEVLRSRFREFQKVVGVTFARELCFATAARSELPVNTDKRRNTNCSDARSKS